MAVLLLHADVNLRVVAGTTCAVALDHPDCTTHSNGSDLDVELGWITVARWTLERPRPGGDHETDTDTDTDTDYQPGYTGGQRRRRRF